MARSLDELKQILAHGQRQSMQGSYEGLLPGRRARPDLFEAQSGLREYTEEHPDDETGWRLLVLAEACVTNFRAAITCLERAMELSGQRSRKDLKTLARLREHAIDPPKRDR